MFTKITANDIVDAYNRRYHNDFNDEDIFMVYDRERSIDKHTVLAKIIQINKTTDNDYIFTVKYEEDGSLQSYRILNEDENPKLLSKIMGVESFQNMIDMNDPYCESPSEFSYLFIPKRDYDRYRQIIYPSRLDYPDGETFEYVRHIDNDHVLYKYGFCDGSNIHHEWYLTMTRDDIDKLMDDAYSFISALGDVLFDTDAIGFDHDFSGE